MNPREATSIRTERVRRRVRELLTRRFSLRAHMSLVVALSSGAAFLASRVAHLLGLDAMGPRYALACFVAWGAFLTLFRLWLAYFNEAVAADLRPDTEAIASALPARREGAASAGGARSNSTVAPLHTGSDAVTFAGDLACGVGHTDTVRTASSEGGSAASSLSGIDGEGAAVIVVLALVAVALAVFGAAAWIIWEAPVLFAEAAFDVAIASVLVRSSKRIDPQGWSSKVLRATAIPFVIVLVVSTTAGFLVQYACPMATTMGEAVQRCVLDTPKP